MNSFAQTYLFGNTALDPERERKVAIYGRVSTQHEAQIDALGNQMQWYEDQLNYHPKAYRKANKMPTQFREAAWTDLKVEVYI